MAPTRSGRFAAWTWRRVLTVAVAWAGIGTLLYPTAMTWFSDRVHATQTSGYMQDVQTMPTAQQQEMLKVAKAYNDELPGGPLRDPFALTVDGKTEEVGGGQQVYNSVLNVDGHGMMGMLQIPEIGVNLPIYHGTDPSTLDRGIGHLFGSDLPVGGTGTHAVLTGHSGVPESTLFTNLSKLKLKDTFQIFVLDQVLTYQVDQTEVVLPDDTKDLERVPGKDYVTLVTCTPIGINSHRLLVRGVRIPTPAGASGVQSFATNATMPGFPWWAVVFVGTPVGAGVVTHPWRRRKRGYALFSGQPGLRTAPAVDIALPGGRAESYWVEQLVHTKRKDDDDILEATCTSDARPDATLVVRTVEHGVDGNLWAGPAFPWWALLRTEQTAVAAVPTESDRQGPRHFRARTGDMKRARNEQEAPRHAS
ncbi:MAG: class C sortase [Micrococcales bacterium]|nr:class C sortase [Micrococcales bacterium]